ncbi:MAG: glycosyltransferase [Candidatus Pacebacteria bacterium]|jgi:glycosyltransferase involved in cell wall biosynthesis|nr:glycosyltransferase [Candidatus Paceibacterota bacterium]
MARRDLSYRDASAHAASELQSIIRSDKRLAQSDVKKVTAEQGMRGNRVYQVSSNRNITRVLFISQNTELLNPITQSLDGYIDIRDLFDEVHILILRQGIPPKNPVLRPAPNVWLYTASAASWWQLPMAGLSMLKEQLEFASGFRPDLIVARDPFESAVVAILAAKKYDRPTQLHIMEDHTATSAAQKKQPFWRMMLSRYTIPRFASIRTQTGAILTKLQKQFTTNDSAVLPRYQDHEAIIDVPSTLDLKDKYRPMIFFLIYIGQLGHESTFYRALDAARFVLKNQRVGMIVLGDGSARGEFEKRAKLLEIEQQVIFETKAEDVVPYLKSGNLLIVTDTDTDSEDVVLKGAAAGIPMVIARTEKREDIFDHGESAFLCEATDVQAFTDCIDDLLNNIELRQTFTQNSQSLIREKFHSDPREYQEAYRTSIEQAFFADAGNENEATSS